MSAPTSALSEVADLVTGGTPSKKRPEYYLGDIPWITGADISVTGATVTSARSHITREAVKDSATNVVEAGTVLLVTRTSVGKVGIAGMPLAINQDITALRHDPARLDRNYLVRCLQLQARRFEDRAQGATIQGVNRAVVAETPIPMRPMEEQRRIAAVLDAADALRAKRRESLAKLHTLTQAIFIDMFGDPVNNPRGWDTAPLAELGTLDRGVSKHRPRNDPALLGGPWPLVQTGDVASSGGYIRAAGGSYSDLGLAQSRLWPAGTLCITIAANIAKTGVLTFDACFPDSVVGFTSDPATTEFVRAFLGFLQPVLEANAPESAQKNINLKTLRTADAPVPPSALREEFAEAVDGVRAQRARLMGSGESFDELFASLQQRAFRGEL